MTIQKNYVLDNLPKYSSWLARFLGLILWEKHILNTKEILREYEDEKWGSLLSKMNKSGKKFSLENIEKL